jgi:hypothetical protein
MNFSKMFRARAAVAVLALVSFVPAFGEWQNLSSTLPGTTSGTKVAIGAGAGAGAIGALLIYRHVHKPPPFPAEVPARIVFGPGSSEQTLTIVPKTEGLNFSEISVKGKGYKLAGGGPELPMLLDQPVELRITSDSAGKGQIDLTLLDSGGKAHSKTVALVVSK